MKIQSIRSIKYTLSNFFLIYYSSSKLNYEKNYTRLNIDGQFKYFFKN